VKAGAESIPGRKKRCPACEQEYSATEVICPRDGYILGFVPIKDLIGSKLADKYEILAEVDRGGMSVIYKGKHQAIDRIVAVKVLQAQLIDDEVSIKRFQQEAQAASHLAHTNIIGVHDFGVAPTGQPYIVMDFLQGESLAHIVRREDHVDYRRLISIFMQTCDALEHAHNKGVIHRDLKSSNIMLIESDGVPDIVKVVDFGIAKLMPSSGKQPQNLTNTGEIFGSPIYMSPEQCLGQVLDARSDIYSMGTMMYETLTGLPPLMGDTIVDTMRMHVNNIPRPFKEVRSDLHIPPDLEAIVFKTLEKSPDKRFQTMRECYQDLKQLETSLAGEQAGDGSQDTSRNVRQRTSISRSASGLQPNLNSPKPRLHSSERYGKTDIDLNNPERNPTSGSPFPEPRKSPQIDNLRRVSKPDFRQPTRLTAILLAVIVFVISFVIFVLLRHR
jgi:serine/threonine protein kinase